MSRYHESSTGSDDDPLGQPKQAHPSEACSEEDDDELSIREDSGDDGDDDEEPEFLSDDSDQNDQYPLSDEDCFSSDSSVNGEDDDMDDNKDAYAEEEDMSFCASLCTSPTVIAEDGSDSGTRDIVVEAVRRMSLGIGLTPKSIQMGTLGEEIVVDPISRSLFEDGEDVLYFPKPNERVGPLHKSLRKVLKWKIGSFTPNVVRYAVSRANFTLLRKGKRWIGSWGKHFSSKKFRLVHPWQKVNHFPRSFEIGRKDKLLMNYQRLRRACEAQSFDYLPETYILPRQRGSLENAFASHPLWIMKPPASARGQGIRVVKDFAKVPRKKPLVVSRYIMRPYLIGGRKFDIRLYVAVTSFEPLRIYLYQDGVVRFASEKYTTQKSCIRNRFIHLTNYSVAKRRRKSGASLEDHRHGTCVNDYLLGDTRFPAKACKWSFKDLQEYFRRIGVDFALVYEQINDLIVKTIITGHAANVSGMRLCTRSRASCFEVFGFDVLLDSRLKPWLMEVNISPSLKASNEMDFGIKLGMVTDLLNLVGVRLRDIRACRDSAKDEKRRDEGPFGSFTAEKARHKSFVNAKPSDYLTDMTAEDLKILKEVEDEYTRRGDFERLFPSPTSSQYDRYFDVVPYFDRLVHHWLNQPDLSEDPDARVAKLRCLVPTQDSACSLPNLSRSASSSLSGFLPSRSASPASTRSSTSGSSTSLAFDRAGRASSSSSAGGRSSASLAAKNSGPRASSYSSLQRRAISNIMLSSRPLNNELAASMRMASSGRICSSSGGYMSVRSMRVAQSQMLPPRPQSCGVQTVTYTSPAAATDGNPYGTAAQSVTVLKVRHLSLAAGPAGKDVRMMDLKQFRGSTGDLPAWSASGNPSVRASKKDTDRRRE
ncbi:tubulin-tyrosine ligase family-domain-containing protein [Fimicolochytrium jonesii]|uniref:tubulin-tyrosine ligase family-domain-containing protein n=1 Tax=Fimicolochytrium jonesii TaxID=1396493 RepID=UPI0022FDB834|nr:tubulin-tyrosine ligase family-domain-containing protein [Fimicolochytrium jonesii]KAI8825142.1 tubulin-tyrosine ligase family-domain-containing protein [Fimicolochytrium jonesii]